MTTSIFAKRLLRLIKEGGRVLYGEGLLIYEDESEVIVVRPLWLKGFRLRVKQNTRGRRKVVDWR